MSTILETKDLSIAFGGHQAVKNISLQIHEKKLTSIIGPNGAGKTTFFNLLSGQLAPTNGSVFFRGQNITNLSATERTRLGIGRSFQITNVFPNLSVLENVRLAVQAQEKIRYQMIAHYRHYRQFEEKAIGLLEKVMLKDQLKTKAIDLPHGDKRKLEIAMLLALETEVLLLDEPTAGMSLEEVPGIIEVIHQMKEENIRTIVLIEHKMDMIIDLSDEVLVLFYGELLAKGTPEEIIANETVQSAYLGGIFHEAST